jgi:hypothetical protein
MDLSADAAFVNNTRPGTPAAVAEASTSAGPSKQERRDSSSTIRPEGVVVEEKEGGEEKEKDAAVKNESAATTATATATAAGLEQEVGQVVQQLSSWGGSFWGGFRKQASQFDHKMNTQVLTHGLSCSRPTLPWMPSRRTLLER